MSIRRQLIPAVVMLGLFTVLCGVVYPLAVTGVAQTVIGDRADGSFVEVDGNRVGSRLLGQSFTGRGDFHPRPSAAGDGYDGLASGGSNLGPSSDELADAVNQRVAEYREENGLAADAEVPVDAVTASGSGLDPHITPANAKLQAPRVAAARQLPLRKVLALVEAHTDGRSLGFLGEPGVNVLELNLALDRAAADRP